MSTPPVWLATPPATSSSTRGFLTEPESLTERLIASGRTFAVHVLFQGNDTAFEDEVPLLDGQHMVFARHVALTLDGVAVVTARSICLAGCPHWQALLDRGSRSLGLTLFGGLPLLERGALAFAEIASGDPRHTLSASPVASLPARRCCFRLHGAPLIVTELFLPALEHTQPC